MKLSWNPKRIFSTRGVVCAGLVAAMTLGACGDDGVKQPASDVPLFDVGQNFPDVLPVDTSLPDIATPDVRQDTAQPFDSTAPDLVPDLNPPVIVSSIPADGAAGVALPLVVTLNFDEPILRNLISAGATSGPGQGTGGTVRLLGPNNEDIPIDITWEGQGQSVNPTKLTITPRPGVKIFHASPYKVRVVGGNPALSDLAGNRLVNDIFVSFTTANFPNMDTYKTLAAKYAPVIYSAVEGKELPQSQVPTKFDVDGDWDLSDNRQWLRTESGADNSPVIPAVYFNVSESYTHYFIQYVYYFPDMNRPENPFSNGTSGVLVTVEKVNGEVAERPIAAHVYSQFDQYEEQEAFITTESGLAGIEKTRATVAESTLFPSGHFESFINAKTHEHCFRRYGRDGVFGRCTTNRETYSGDQLVFSFDDRGPYLFKKQGGAFPSTMSEITGAPESLGYVLIPLSSTLWPRRFETGNNAIFSAQRFAYEGRDASHGAGMSLTKKLLETTGAATTNFGRAPWAWGWHPSNSGTGFGGFMEVDGAVAIDPAEYFFFRHNADNRPASPLQKWVSAPPAAPTGFATNYCFNMFLNIDKRIDDPDCLAR